MGSTNAYLGYFYFYAFLPIFDKLHTTLIRICQINSGSFSSPMSMPGILESHLSVLPNAYVISSPRPSIEVPSGRIQHCRCYGADTLLMVGRTHFLLRCISLSGNAGTRDLAITIHQAEETTLWYSLLLPSWSLHTLLLRCLY